MNGRILNILSMCLKLKDVGHDVFFNYSPHVQTIEVSVFVVGWSERRPEYNKEVYIDSRHICFEEEKLAELEHMLSDLLGGASSD